VLHQGASVPLVSPQLGWYGNGAGKLFQTTDGGERWTLLWSQEGTFVRALAFVDEQTGWVGAVPHGFATTDGGQTWTAAAFGKAVNKIRLVPEAEGTTAYAIGVDVYKLSGLRAR
jgi:photosystem II stability/assembly factor-like uncharacterized protein